ncbi:retinitis pigmentosa 1-like 1 protein [Schistocerca nitens]|uniref:retinitis pigmentosa 1-like 1 protein n=1 Tax=Schistocerca nitens TaxID=7011 RepID=UPI002117614C|nr:retinitis pigmentosa 1-like 1 protein [Schistocerca nitens]
MRAFAPALLSALVFIQVDSAVNILKELRRNGGSLSWVLELQVRSHPEYTNKKEYRSRSPPIHVKGITQEEVEHAATRKQLLTTADTRTNTSLDTKALDVTQQRPEGTDAQTERIKSGNAPGIERTLAQNETEHTTTQLAQTETELTATQKQVLVADNSRNNTFMRTKILIIDEERPQGIDSHTERRQGGNLPRSEEAVAQNETERTATKKRVPLDGDRRTSTFLETEPLGAIQERTLSSDIKPERRQNGNSQGSEGALAKTDTEYTTTQTHVLAAGEKRTNTFRESKLPDVTQERPEGTDAQTERRRGGDVPGREEALAQNETEHITTQEKFLADGDRRTNKFLDTKPLVAQERPKGTDAQTERRQGVDVPGKKEVLAQNETELTATQKQVPPAGNTRTSAFLEVKPLADSQKRNEGAQGQIEKGQGIQVQENEKSLLPSFGGNGSETTLIESGKEMHQVAKDSKEAKSSRTSSQRQAPGSWEATETSQGSDQLTTTENERQIVQGKSQMARGVSDATTEANEVSLAPAKDRTNLERSNVLTGAVEGAQVAARAEVNSLEPEEVLRQTVTTTEEVGVPQTSQLERYGASRSSTERTAASEGNGVKFTDDLTSGSGFKTSTTGRSLVSQDGGETEVDSSLENPATLRMSTVVDEMQVLLQADATTAGGGDYGAEVAARAEMNSLEPEEVARQTTTEEVRVPQTSQLERYGASRSSTDRTAASEGRIRPLAIVSDIGIEDTGLARDSELYYY